MFLPGGDMQMASPFPKAFYFITGFGHEAVSVFFVISGYLVGGKVWVSTKERRFLWCKYLLDRSTRLYAVLIAALLLGALLDFVGSRYVNTAGLYDLTFPGRKAVLQTPAVDNLSVQVFVLNAVFLQTIAGPTFGSNAPLWSLANEWWYYVAFPAACLLLWSSARLAKVYAVLTLAALAVFLPWQIVILFGVWLLGVLVSQSRMPLCPWWLSLLIFLFILAAARLEIVGGYNLWMYIVGAGFALLLNSLHDLDLIFPFQNISRTLADFSYSVYLVHFPVMMFFVSCLYASMGKGTGLVFGATGLALFASVCAVVILVAWFVSLLTEAQTPRLRALAYGWFGVGASRPR
jgi:peptidoglycan/LPS O-acetylase OafA/YrhL